MQKTISCTSYQFTDAILKRCQVNKYKNKTITVQPEFWCRARIHKIRLQTDIFYSLVLVGTSYVEYWIICPLDLRIIIKKVLLLILLGSLYFNVLYSIK